MKTKKIEKRIETLYDEVNQREFEISEMVKSHKWDIPRLKMLCDQTTIIHNQIIILEELITPSCFAETLSDLNISQDKKVGF